MAQAMGLTTDGFYFWLPSNTPSTSGKPNTASDFTVPTQFTEQLQGKWEVALTEIHYPNDWKNVPRTVHLVIKTKDRTTGAVIDKEWVSIPPANYDSVDEVLQIINDKSKLIFCKREDEGEKVLITCKEKEIRTTIPVTRNNGDFLIIWGLVPPLAMKCGLSRVRQILLVWL